jgi:hypothetical protein
VPGKLPLPAHAGSGRIAGIDLNKPRIRAALSAALALAPAPGGFTAAEFTAKVRHLIRQDGYTTRPDPPLPRPARRRPHHRRPARPPRPRHRTLLAGVRSPRMGRRPKIWTAVDRDYETLRIGMQTLFRHVGIATRPAAA